MNITRHFLKKCTDANIDNFIKRFLQWNGDHIYFFVQELSGINY